MSRRRVQWIDERSKPEAKKEERRSVRWNPVLTQETCIDELETCTRFHGSSSSSLSYEVDDLIVGFSSGGGLPRGGRQGSRDDISIGSECSYGEFFGENGGGDDDDGTSNDFVAAMGVGDIDDMSAASSAQSSATGGMGGINDPNDDDSLMMLPNGRIVSKSQAAAVLFAGGNDSMQTFSGSAPRSSGAPSASKRATNKEVPPAGAFPLLPLATPSRLRPRNS